MQSTQQLLAVITAQSDPAGGAALADLAGGAVAGALLTAVVCGWPSRTEAVVSSGSAGWPPSVDA